jgi:hypothetical protein
MIKSAILVIVISTSLTTCHWAKPLTVKEKNVIEHLTSRMKTRCAGRYIVDLPRELLVDGNITINDVRITSSPEKDLRSFQAMLVRREFRLREKKSRDAYPFLYKVGKGTSEHTKYFVSRERTDNYPDFRKIEAYKWDNGYAIKLEIDARDYTDPDRTSDSLVQKIGITNDVPQKLDLVLNFLDRVRGRSEDDIPSEPGVCFFGGFMKGEALRNVETENVKTVYTMLHNPDAFFKIETDTDIQEDTTLLERSRAFNVYALHFNVKTLRRGVVDLPNLPAEEWLTSANTLEGAPGHYLTLEANTKIGSPRTPFLMLNFKTGVATYALETSPKSSSLSDNEVVGLWDAVTRTLRPRPNGF